MSHKISENEIINISNLIFAQEAASDALSEALKAMKEKYDVDPSVLKSFVKSKFGDQEKHQNNLDKHQLFIDLDENI